MFDFSTTGILLAALSNAWAAYSATATVVGAAGALALAAAFLLTPYLPTGVRHALFFGGALVLAGAVYGQVEHSRGAAAASLLAADRATAAEKTRADESEENTRIFAAAAVAEREAALADQAELKRFLRDVSLATSSGELCGSRDDAERLRALRQHARPR